MPVIQGLNPRRVARSLVTVLLLTLIQIVAAPILSPETQVERADAAPVSVAYASNTAGFNIIVPSGVFSVTLTARGGAGGKGGNDASAGLASTNVGSVTGTFAVSPGDRISIYPGGAGGGGADSAKNSGAGSAGSSSVYVYGGVLTPTFRFNSIATAALIANGGSGGNAGSGGTSGSGGGGGAATIVAINDNVALVAGGGGGGGGGSGPGAQPWNGTHVANGSNPAGANGLYGGDCGNTDGGGSGGGGGGWYGGAAGTVDRPGGTGECRAFSGSAGGNFLGNTASSTSNGYIAANGAGEGTYDFIYSATTSCTTDQQSSDIYTIVKVTTTAECTWTVPSTVSVLDLFLVGGGGGGAGDAGPGGGGGATLSRTAVAVSPSSTMRLKVGHGGAGGGWGIVGSTSRGDSTTVVTSTGSVLYALGGTKSENGPTATVTGNQSVQAGSFDGGIGGTATPNSNTVGGVGKAGVSNYFYGSQNTYAGGGGGGCYFTSTHNVSVAGALGTHGGGSGCSYNTTTKNSNGSNGTAGTGGGGGGGGAGDAMRTLGGKGGSGVILIRYATNAINAFPTSVAGALSGRWTPNELQLLDSTRKGWVDSSGTNASASITGSPIITTQGTLDGGNSTGSSKSNLIAAGGTSDKTTFISGALSNYTILHVARYPRTTIAGGAMTGGRLVTASSGNFISGHYNTGTENAAHPNNGWITPTGIATQHKWLLSTDMPKLYRANGRNLTYKADVAAVANATGPTGLGINNFATEPTDWQMQDVLVFNRQLTNGEVRAMEQYLARIYGLTLDPEVAATETDTAATLGSGNAFYFNDLGAGNVINDTFTIEAWVKVNDSCPSICQIIVKEYAVLLGIENGSLYWAMYNKAGVGWSWKNTGIKVPAGEWHHVAMVKQYSGDKNGSLLFYFDGQLAYTEVGSPYVTAGNNSEAATYGIYDPDLYWFYIGIRANGTQAFYGQVDEVKIWKVPRTASEVVQDMHSNDGSNTNLQMYYDFNKINSSYPDISDGAVQPIVPNLAAGGIARSDLYTYYGSTYPMIESRSTVGVYTTVTFPRTIITQSGGWKIPSNLTSATAIVVGGGGGGGFGSSSNRPAGGGGGGGVTASLTQSFTPGATVTVKVGVGGLGGFAADDASVRNGQSSTLGVGGGLVALGGGGGGNNGGNGAGGSTVATGGGSGASSYTCTGSPLAPSGTLVPGATVTSGNNGGGGIWGWGGSGGGARGAAINGTCSTLGSGTPGPGYFDPITNIEYGRGGSADAYTSTSTVAGNNTQNNGWGGIISYNGGNSTGVGYRGSSGSVVIRYITAAKPTYTKPSNAYLNVGMTETFTTNVASDSATVGLTRTFKWESTTPTANGSYTVLKTGTGAANAAFSWVPTDTSTSGSGYLYRLTVTDSDTAGLFITDSSTAFAVINRALVVTSTASSTSLAKKINVARSETYTITLGTPTYRATLSPVIPGISIDTSTAGSVILRISDTASVGTWLETLTVTDSVSASVVIPLTIVVAAPPTLLNTNEIVTNGLVFNLDAGNSASIILEDSATATGVTMNDLSGRKNNATSGAGVNTGGYSSTGCTAPKYSSDNGGAVVFTGSTDNCLYSTFTGREFDKSYTFEAWFKTSATLANWAAVAAQGYTSGSQPISVTIGSMGGSAMYVGFYDGGNWRYANCGYTPVVGAWTHIAGTFDGATMKTYINGSNIVNGSACSSALTTGFGATINPNGMIIGKGHMGGTGAYTFAGSIASLRLYNIPFSSAQILQNYNATKYRFETENQSIVKPSKKYGTTVAESFTVTSGFDTRTVTFNTGNRSGIAWDTTTIAGRVDLSIQDSLTVGTYYDTVTVTDSLGQSTYLPLKMSVTKADSLTVSMDTATTVSYNGSPITIYPRTTIKGLKSSDTATSVVRFSSSLYSESTVVPTNADTYTVRGTEPVFTIGLLSNYEGVIYETRTAVVKKINQRPLNIFKYGGTVGTSFVISLQGGDGTGAVTETLTGLSSLTGCAISNHKLSATEQKQGFCEVRVVKAGDQNYFAETETAQLYFMAFVNNQPTGQVGSGPTIGLNGATSFETSTVSPPAITGLSALTISKSAGGTFTITGTGFTGSISVKFWRNKVIVTTSGNGTTIDIPVVDISNIGATSGRIAVITAAGEAVSVDTLTINP